MRNVLGIVAGFGLLTVTGDEHRLMRRAMNPAFSIPNLSSRECGISTVRVSLVDVIPPETEMFYEPIEV
jgi:cytochrome P450